MHTDEVDVDEGLVRRLLRAQLPDLADLPLTVVEPWGTDNAIWRLGDDLVVRLPRIHWATGQPHKEATWLPRLAAHLPVAVPEPVALGAPGLGYPHPWAVHRWLPGQPAALREMSDPVTFARDLADVVRALRALPVDGAPPAHSRARPLADYDDATRQAIDRARHLVDVDAALAVWQEALAAPVHDALDVDDATLARSKGAAVNQACAALPYYLDTYPLIVERSLHKLTALGIPTTPTNRS